MKKLVKHNRSGESMVIDIVDNMVIGESMLLTQSELLDLSIGAMTIEDVEIEYHDPINQDVDWV